MIKYRNICAAALIAVPLLGGCQNQEQSGALIGGTGGAVAGSLIGRSFGGTAGAVIGGIVGGVGGAFAGSAIGRRLDEGDRAKAQAATQQALAAPAPVPPATPQAAPTPVAQPRPVAWNSTNNANVRGSSTVTGVQRAADGGECRMVRETAYIQGEEVVQNNRYCRGGDGQWALRS